MPGLSGYPQNGGVAMVNFWTLYLDPRVMIARAKKEPPPPVPLSVLIDHIDRLTDVMALDNTRSRARSPGEWPAGHDLMKKLVTNPSRTAQATT